LNRLIVCRSDISSVDELTRLQILRQYFDVPEDSDATFHKPFLRSSADRTSFTRYRDSMVVTNKGQKYVIEKDDSEDERLKHTFVSLKIKTKGKRGPGTKKV